MSRLDATKGSKRCPPHRWPPEARGCEAAECLDCGQRDWVTNGAFRTGKVSKAVCSTCGGTGKAPEPSGAANRQCSICGLDLSERQVDRCVVCSGRSNLGQEALDSTDFERGIQEGLRMAQEMLSGVIQECRISRKRAWADRYRLASIKIRSSGSGEGDAHG